MHWRNTQWFCLDTESIAGAFQVEGRFGFSPQDALVYASIAAHLPKVPGIAKIFVTQNARDFFIPSVEQELDSHGCKLLTNFESAEAFVLNKIAG